MQSLARRGVRTTVAVAGLTAVGVGLAAPAFAAPDLPEASGLGNVTATDQPTRGAKNLTTVNTLPDRFHFEMPTVNGSAPTATLPAVPSVPSANVPAAASTSSLPTGLPNVQVVPQVAGFDPASALQALDGANLF